MQKGSKEIENAIKNVADSLYQNDDGTYSAPILSYASFFLDRMEENADFCASVINSCLMVDKNNEDKKLYDSAHKLLFCLGEELKNRPNLKANVDKVTDKFKEVPSSPKGHLDSL